MKLLPLVLANLRRHRLRTLLTTLGVALATFLFASLRSVVTTLNAGAEVASASRMGVQNATAIVFPLPLSYRERLAAVPGVAAVTWANWFGGLYGDGKTFFAQFAVDPETYLAMYPEISVPPGQKEAFLHERTAALVGKGLMEKVGWRLGQDVTIRGSAAMRRSLSREIPLSISLAAPRRSTITLPGKPVFTRAARNPLASASIATNTATTRLTPSAVIAVETGRWPMLRRL